MVPLIEIDDLTVSFDDVAAVRGVSISVSAGEAIGVIGESGCGKSVTWLAALGLLPKSARISGTVRLAGRDVGGAETGSLDGIRGRRIAMIFQDPASSLNPIKRVGAQVVEVLRLHRGMDGAAARAEAKRLFDQVGIADAANRLDAYPHELSGGQNQRVMIAMALAGRPDVLIADEPTTALDVTIQAQILDLLKDIRKTTGMAVVLISHDLGIISEMCTRAYVMYAGKVVEKGSVADLFAAPGHPYTRGLLASIPSLSGPKRRLVPIPGGVPTPTELREGCAFAPRCRERHEACHRQEPRLKPLRYDRPDTQFAACLQREAATIVESAA